MYEKVRICRKCNVCIEYTSKSMFDQANRRNSLCNNCSHTTKIPKFKFPDKLERICPRENCNNVTTYSYKRTWYNAMIKNRLCHSCAMKYSEITCAEGYHEKRGANITIGKTGIRYDPIYKSMSDEEYFEFIKCKEIYYKEVRYWTERQPIHLLEHYEKRGRCDIDENAYNLDHIIPIIYGFKNNIDPKIIGNISNLRFIPWDENVKKSSKLI